MIDYQNLLYNPIYQIQGVSAYITPVIGPNITVTVLDLTHGKSANLGRNSLVETMEPRCRVRMVELRQYGLTQDSLDMAQITFNGVNWFARTSEPRPSPNGIFDGELELVLTESPTISGIGETDGTSSAGGTQTPNASGSSTGQSDVEGTA
jgi:hypothetical protein